VHGPHQDRARRTEQVSTLTPRPASGPRERGLQTPYGNLTALRD
jgi:hypothetical protein